MAVKVSRKNEGGECHFRTNLRRIRNERDTNRIGAVHTLWPFVPYNFNNVRNFRKKSLIIKALAYLCIQAPLYIMYIECTVEEAPSLLRSQRGTEFSYIHLASVKYTMTWWQVIAAAAACRLWLPPPHTSPFSLRYIITRNSVNVSENSFSHWVASTLCDASLLNIDRSRWEGVQLPYGVFGFCVLFRKRMYCRVDGFNI